MLTPVYLSSFEKSYKRLRKGGKVSRADVEELVLMISNYETLPFKYKDHKLSGEYEGYRECHLKYDLLLIYKIKKVGSTLILKNIGSHSELF